MRVLVVDDDAPILDVVDELLTFEGFEVRSEVDPRRALLAAKTFRPDVALIDFNMPWIDGLTLARRLREDPSTRDVPIVMMTAHPPPADLIEAANVAVLAKPFSIDRLLAMLRLHGHDSFERPSPP